MRIEGGNSKTHTMDEYEASVRREANKYLCFYRI